MEYLRDTIVSILLAVLVVSTNAGCVSYSFGMDKLLPSEKNPRYSLYVGITPKEWPGSGIARRAVFQVLLSDWETSKHLIRYERMIMVANLDYDVRMKNQQLCIVAQDRYDKTKKWSLTYAEEQPGQFRLVKEEGVFILR